MEFCKQDPNIKGKFNVETDNIQQLLKLFYNKKLDVKWLERMSRDFNLDYQQMLITQVRLRHFGISTFLSNKKSF